MDFLQDAVSLYSNYYVLIYGSPDQDDPRKLPGIHKQ